MLTERRKERWTSSIHKPELLCNPPKNVFVFQGTEYGQCKQNQKIQLLSKYGPFQCGSFTLFNRRQFLFTHRPEKHKLGRRRWDLASCQVSLNSFQRFQRRSRKCLSQSYTRVAILFSRSARKTQTWQKMLRSCFLSSLVEFRSAVS